MGRQIGFYFDKRDEEKFLDFFSNEPVEFISYDVLSQPRCEAYRAFENDHPKGSRSQALICYECELERLTYRSTKGGDFYVCSGTSPVIEFTRAYYDPDLSALISGRIWYERTFWDKDENGNDILVEKNPELLRLYNRLASWIRRHCKRLPNGNYLGPHAEKLHEKGAELR